MAVAAVPIVIVGAIGIAAIWAIKNMQEALSKHEGPLFPSSTEYPAEAPVIPDRTEYPSSSDAALGSSTEFPVKEPCGVLGCSTVYNMEGGTEPAKGVPKIHPGKQGKHIPGHNNFQPGKSELTHPDPQDLINKGTGTGVQHGNKEVVDFGEIIGIHVTQDGTRSPTSRGTIHTDTKGNAHIVPASPEVIE